jgi:CHAT domain-containing protein
VTLAETLSRTVPPRERRDVLRRAAPDEAAVGSVLAELPRLRRLDPAGAVRAAKTTLAAVRLGGERALVARASESLGNALLWLGRPKDALRRLGAAARTDASRAPIVAPASAHALAILGRVEEARAVLASAREALPARGAWQHRAAIEAAEASILERTERPAEALAAFERARAALARSKGSQAAVAAIDHSRANLLSNTDRFATAQRLYLRVARFHRARGQEAAARLADYNLAYLRYLRGAFHDSLARFDALRARFQEAGDRRLVALCDLDTAEIHLRLNVPAEAAVRARRAAHVFDELGMGQDAARARFFVAVAALAVDGPEEAIPALERARDELRATGCESWSAVAVHRLAEARREAGHVAEARVEAEEAAARLEALGLRERAGRAECLLAAIEVEGGDAPAALRRLDALRARTHGLYAPWLSCEIDHRAALACAALDRHREAVKHAIRAARTLERHRVTAPPDEYMAAFLRDKAAVHVNAVRAVLRLGGRRAGALAFELAEEGRGRALADLLGRKTPSAPPGTVAHEVDRLEGEIDALAGRLPPTDGSRGPSAEAAAKASSDRAVRLRRCLDLLAVRDPAAASVRGAGSARLAEVQKALPEDAALLEYVVDEDSVCAFVIDRGHVHVVRWAEDREAFRRHVRRARFQLDRPPAFDAVMGPEVARALVESADAALDALGALVLGPVREHLVARRLIVVPHGELHGIPFHALRVDGKALVERHEVVLAPSASVWLRCLARPPAPTDRCLVLGVPDESAPFLFDEACEVQAIHGGPAPRLGARATRRALARLGRDARVVHIASHGEHREDDPMLSGLLLGDGWLTLSDLLDMRLRSELVVLSGCATGRAWVSEGDDLFGLVRGFLHAGARDFVGSLWRVSDRTATEFMRRFHRALAGGDAPAEALRRATLELREIHPHPHDWAPFVLTGTGGVPRRTSCVEAS